ncbi:2-amino-3-carboxymuconate-6-semialdehyde decarboxylase [Cladophialophora carrionii]|uniref:2-amino-3-carboxymuconate-6-semialdehyde decarboxylase n=1 Tax=Cladophialophora carrionii TaxID=86049 RepID=A0A1C1CE27_9EURO|nr:2-amino-3-carboxymuconate-6-semialdehyde decarboxylase [Cladophialophora carrionii]
MAPTGWLDVHTHFFPPMTDEQAEDLAQNLRKGNFMVTAASLHWTAEKVIEYNNSAGVQMSLLSYIPTQHERIRAANDLGHEIVKKYPDRFGQLLSLPTDDEDACLEEISRAAQWDLRPDGYSTSTVYNGVPLSDPRLDKVWELLDQEQAVVHVHPNAYAPGTHGRPSPLIEVAFDTTRIATDMLYKGVFRRFTNINFVFGHCGGALPALSGRISLLGTESWVPNPLDLTRDEIEKQLSSLYVDTAATAKTGLAPAANMVGISHCVYGSDCGVPCSTANTMNENKSDVETFEKKQGLAPGTIAKNTWNLFPAAAKRAERDDHLADRIP